jgi:glycolate oxidase
VVSSTNARNKWKEQLPVILEELYKLTASLDGRISGEHGIGHKRKFPFENSS